MAQKLKPDDGRATKDHNVKHIKETIRSVADNVIGLKAERSALNEQITEERARLKAFGIKMVDFNAMMRLYELEAEDRNESLDAIRLMFEGLGLGGQGDLFPEPAPEPPPAKPGRSGKKAANGTAKAPASDSTDAEAMVQQGVDAGYAGRNRDENPHPVGTEAHGYWRQGWTGGQRKRAAEMAPGTASSEPQPAA